MPAAETRARATALLTRAQEQRDAGRLVDAEAVCRTALTLAPDDSEAHRLLGTILQRHDRGDAAVDSFQTAVYLDARNAKAFEQLAVALSEAGRLTEAVDADRRALQTNPHSVGALCHLARLKTFTAGDPDLAALEAVADDAESLPKREQMLLHFALAKAYDDIGDNARSFMALERGNALKRSTLAYDVADDVRLLESITRVFDETSLARVDPTASQSELPILVVGMPRSGTTLVEQILASHPCVSGAGELADLEQLSAAIGVLHERGLPFPEGVVQLPAADLGRLGHAYVERLRRRCPEAERITDKAPMNFRYLGLLRLMVPRARVIHCVRDPIDTCLSCYGLLFKSGVPFSYDLADLGRYYRAYARLMDHWRRVLPDGWMLDVAYEDLVSDVENAAKRIIAHCRLDWYDGCLSFHSTERTVRTASFAQVRQPTYGSSVGRWRRYEPYVGRLVDALEL